MQNFNWISQDLLELFKNREKISKIVESNWFGPKLSMLGCALPESSKNTKSICYFHECLVTCKKKQTS